MGFSFSSHVIVYAGALRRAPRTAVARLVFETYLTFGVAGSAASASDTRLTGPRRQRLVRAPAPRNYKDRLQQRGSDGEALSGLQLWLTIRMIENSRRVGNLF